MREIAHVLHRQNDATKTLSLLFAIYRQFPKLNVAGSIPVSRSIKSTRYDETIKPLLHSCSNYMTTRLFSS
jgi:hypothetical protein